MTPDDHSWYGMGLQCPLQTLYLTHILKLLPSLLNMGCKQFSYFFISLHNNFGHAWWVIDKQHCHTAFRWSRHHYGLLGMNPAGALTCWNGAHRSPDGLSTYPLTAVMEMQWTEGADGRSLVVVVAGRNWAGSLLGWPPSQHLSA